MLIAKFTRSYCRAVASRNLRSFGRDSRVEGNLSFEIFFRKVFRVYDSFKLNVLVASKDNVESEI